MILAIIIGILLIVGLVLLLQKFASPKIAPIVSILLFLVAIFLGYKVYNSIMGPVEFNKAKEERYKKVIAKLKDIKAAELAYQEVVGGFNGDFDSLVQFLDTAQFAITQRRDTVYDDVEKNKAYGIDEGYYIEEVLIDTLRFTSVKDSLYAGDRYKTMMNVPGTDTKFDLDAGTLDKDGTKYAVFEAKVSKDVVLQGLNKDLITQEKMVQSVDGVNGEYLKVGSMNEVNTSGNWPKLYDTAKDQ
tara:strand:- start:121143 stop:121874 length:732 start_codon:yes stop_codon:yes gene_type:complete